MLPHARFLNDSAHHRSLAGAFLYRLNVRAPKRPPVISFPSATAEGAISLQAGPRRDLELMQGRAAPSRTFSVFGLCLRSRHPWLS